jgi:uncharacterized protein (TIGR02996 family)
MSADRQALLDALRDEPDNDRLRLVYADWLDDNGEHARAEYVRLCHELAAVADEDRAAALHRRRLQLFRRHKKDWGPGLPRPVLGVLEARGLVQELQTSAATFLKCADQLRQEPLARVRLTGAGPSHVKKLAGCAALADVRELALVGGTVNEQGMRALADSPHLGRLHTLRLVSCRVNAPVAAVLAQAPWLGNLHTLDLGHYERHEGAASQVAWRNEGIFRAIGMGATNHLDDAGFATLLGSPHLRNLETLIVANNWIRYESARLLWTEARLPKLRRLDMSYNWLTPAGLRELAASDLMKRLTMLEIQANEVGSEAVAALAASPNVARLKALDVSGTTAYDDRPKLTSAAAVALAESPHLRDLEHLVLAFSAITASGAQALARTANLPSLRTLHLANNPIRDRGARALASSPLLGRLEVLDLSACELGSAGALAFARSKTAGERLRLELALNAIDEKATQALTERFGGRVSLVAPAPEVEEFYLDEDEMPF